MTIIVCCHNEICLSKKNKSHSFEACDKTWKCMRSGHLPVSKCDEILISNVNKQLWNVAMITMLQWNFSLVLCLSLLVRWIFHSTRFNWVKKYLLSVKKRARISLPSFPKQTKIWKNAFKHPKLHFSERFPASEENWTFKRLQF